MGGQTAQFYGDQTAAPLQIFQQQRCAELRRRADPLPVKTLIPHQLQRLPGGWIELGKVEKLVQRLGDEDLEVEFLRQSIKRLSTLVLVQKQEHIALVQKGVAVRKPRLQCLLQPALPGVNAAIGR